METVLSPYWVQITKQHRRVCSQGPSANEKTLYRKYYGFWRIHDTRTSNRFLCLVHHTMCIKIYSFDTRFPIVWQNQNYWFLEHTHIDTSIRHQHRKIGERKKELVEVTDHVSDQWPIHKGRPSRPNKRLRWRMRMMISYRMTTGFWNLNRSVYWESNSIFSSKVDMK